MNVQVNPERNRDRIKSALAVAAFHALLGYALVTGLGIDVAAGVGEELKLFDVPQEQPPPPVEEPVPAKKRSEVEEGAAAPAGLKTQASPIVAPPPEIRLELPSPVIAAPVAGLGSDTSQGASDIPGPGPGAGGVGTGTGSGSRGDGAGGGGVQIPARWVRGRLRNSDYPRGASRAGLGGTVTVLFTVGVDGRVSGCSIVQSSGIPELDATTCGLIERRFRYSPARDAQGRPVPSETGWRQVWWLED